MNADRLREKAENNSISDQRSQGSSDVRDEAYTVKKWRDNARDNTIRGLGNSGKSCQLTIEEAS